MVNVDSSFSKDNKDVTRIITDITEDPSKEAPDFTQYSQNLSKIIINSDPQFTVGIFGDWGTGKTTLMKMMQEEIDIKYPNIAKTIWFDSWRYEGEEYSALVPLVRTIIIGIQNSIIKTTKNKNIKFLEKNKNIKNLKKIQKHFYKIGEVILKNIELNTDIGIKFGIKKMIDDYQIEGSFFHGRDKIPFYEHISDRLQRELDKIREKNKNFRLVIFIDDLDRCTPERALELLESIKTFFDIKGIIYVIGMDPQTIDPIIQSKYGDKSKIDGMYYLQKIVQLPFQIPVWGSVDLSNMIENLVKKTGLSESYLEEIRKEENQELIIKATQLNPRDIKRFINSIVLAREFYSQDIKNIDKNIDKIIAIQAFYFHGDKWMEFLERLIPYRQRIEFLTNFILLLEIGSKDIISLNDLTKFMKGEYYTEKETSNNYYLYKTLIETYQKNKLLNYIYSKLIKIDDNDLFTFLKIASVPLLKIDKIENYLRIVDTTGLTIKRKDVIIDSQNPLELLQNNKVTEFNNYRKKNENIFIHLAYADLQKRKLSGINLRNSILFKAMLAEVDLSSADLVYADLSGADLTGADLTSLILFGGGNMSGAIFSVANLISTNLYNVDLSRSNCNWATLRSSGLQVDLTDADLTDADISESYFLSTKLIRTNLTGAILSKTDLSNANLTNSILINNTFSENTIVTNANFENAIIDDYKFLEHLRSNICKNIPEKEILTKQELGLKLEIRKLENK
jgi:uncharacterized protein YjbI with pentapeptide repeats